MKYISQPLSHKMALFLFTLFLALPLTACGQISQASNETVSSGLKEVSSNGSGESKRPFFSSQTTVFHSLDGFVDEEPASVDLDVYLCGTEGEFLFIETPKDCTAKISYTYSTEDLGGVSLGLYTESDEQKHASELTPSAPEAYQAFWTDEIVGLKKGMNIFYLSGNDKNCKMHFELTSKDYETFTYVSAFPKAVTDQPDSDEGQPGQ